MDSNLTEYWELVLLRAEFAKRRGRGQAASVAGFLLVFFRVFANLNQYGP
jgi:hypothetical protein